MDLREEERARLEERVVATVRQRAPDAIDEAQVDGERAQQRSHAPADSDNQVKRD